MIDPVSAIGVAAAAAQFFSMALDALELCRQIRDDVDGSTKANKELAITTKNLISISKELHTVVNGNRNESGRRINRIATECVSLSNDLNEILEEIRGAGRAKPIGAVNATFKALRANRKIEKLKNAIKEKQMLLDTAVTHDIRSRVDLLAIEQSQGFSNLNNRTQELIKELRSQQIHASNFAKATEQSMATLTAQGEQIQKTVDAGNQELLKNVADFQSSIEDRLDDLTIDDPKEELLTSLFYPEHAARMETLKPPWQETFDWILDEEEFARRDRQALWSNFSDWLSDVPSIYWINGKAGSGKSTLMAHIIHDPTTRQHLEQWASGRSLHILSFFFWRPGSALQKSIQGALRSILFQLLDEVPGLAGAVLQQFPFTPGRVPTWTESRLRSVLEFAIEAAKDQNCCFCSFIDGLDEFAGDVDELLKLIFALQHHDHVKCCVSSRPEVQLSNGLASYAQLRLESLNYPDIRRFVRGKLQPSHLDSAFINEMTTTISKRAQGVFLWAALTVQSIIRGIASRDDRTTLRRRLDSTSSDLETLLEQMLESIDDVHKESLGFYLKAMSILNTEELKDSQERPANPSIALFTAARSSVDPGNYAEFALSCKRIQEQIIAQSKGLLEVVQISNPQPTSGKLWMLWQDRESRGRINTSNASSRLETMQQRRMGNRDDNTYQLFLHENTRVQWIHRSAHDFLFRTDSKLANQLFSATTELAVSQSLAQGMLKLFVTLPTYQPDRSDRISDRCLNDRFKRCVQVACSMAPISKDPAERLLEELIQLINCCRPKEILVGVTRLFDSEYITPMSLATERARGPQDEIMKRSWEHLMKDLMRMALCKYHISHGKRNKSLCDSVQLLAGESKIAINKMFRSLVVSNVNEREACTIYGLRNFMDLHLAEILKCNSGPRILAYGLRAWGQSISLGEKVDEIAAAHALDILILLKDTYFRRTVLWNADDADAPLTTVGLSILRADVLKLLRQTFLCCVSMCRYIAVKGLNLSTEVPPPCREIFRTLSHDIGGMHTLWGDVLFTLFGKDVQNFSVSNRTYLGEILDLDNVTRYSSP